MALPLQPDLRPRSPWLIRLAVLALLLVVLVLLGWWGASRRPPGRLVLSGPGHGGEQAGALLDLFARARSRIWVVMYRIYPTGSPVQDLLDGLAASAGRGVRVQVGLADGLPDPDNRQSAEWLRQRGVKVVLDEPDRTTHAKAVVVDGRWLLLGSHNWTRNALTRNREASLLVEDRNLAAGLEDFMCGLTGWDPGWGRGQDGTGEGQEPEPPSASGQVGVGE